MYIDTEHKYHSYSDGIEAIEGLLEGFSGTYDAEGIAAEILVEEYEVNTYGRNRSFWHITEEANRATASQIQEVLDRHRIQPVTPARERREQASAPRTETTDQATARRRWLRHGGTSGRTEATGPDQGVAAQIEALRSENVFFKGELAALDLQVEGQAEEIRRLFSAVAGGGLTNGGELVRRNRELHQEFEAFKARVVEVLQHYGDLYSAQGVIRDVLVDLDLVEYASTGE